MFSQLGALITPLPNVLKSKDARLFFRQDLRLPGAMQTVYVCVLACVGLRACVCVCVLLRLCLDV